MSQMQLLLAQFSVLAALLAVVLFGITHDYLWSTFWYSALAHFLGGVWAGLFGAWIFRASRTRGFLLCIGTAIVLGACWEVFEVVINATHFPADTVDTIEDIVMDIVGGAAAAYLARRV